MSVYMLAGIDVTNPSKHLSYIKGAMESLAGFDAEVVTLDESPVTVEGRTSPGRLIIIKYRDRDEFECWYNSERYTNDTRPLRFASSRTDHVWLVTAP
jgi:uncharacterized protein (DUF1330 family)